jgi:hypothetical protein
MCLKTLLAIALAHDTCELEKPRIEGEELVIPFDCHNPGKVPAWSIEYERVRTRRELLDVLGY